MAAERVLVVDDEPGVRRTLSAILADEGYAVSSVGSGEEGIEALRDAPFDAVLLDVWLPGIDGLETLRRLREAHVDAQVVMISGHGTVETAVRATKLGAFDFVEKPLSLEKTLVVVRNALTQRNLERRNRSLVAQIVRDTEIVGSSPHAERLRSEVEAAARSGAAVWIVGEAGTGRERAARRIHSIGARGGQPFVPVPCASLVGDSGGEILFGSGPGRPGLVALASGGTLFLEEVDRIPEALGRRLASELAHGAGTEARPMASTRPDSGPVHADLTHLLDVIRIRTVPLRERREDIPELVRRFARDLFREYGKVERRFAADALAALQSYAWPGNLRELRNVLERIIVTSPADPVTRRDLPSPVGTAGAESEDLYADFRTLAEGTAAFERHFLRRAIASSGGDREAAARRIGLESSVLAEKLRRLGLD
jgi:two-component system nitrogen regulation response regulator NtrX